jgi:hypothetical protein
MARSAGRTNTTGDDVQLFFQKERNKESSVINAGVVGGFSIITHTKKYPRKIQE